MEKQVAQVGDSLLFLNIVLYGDIAYCVQDCSSRHEHLQPSRKLK